MTDVELLNVNRARHFIAFTLEHDMQVKANRSRGGSLLSRSLCAAGDLDFVEFPAEKFDKMMTFFMENDRQVHYQERDSVGVYAITRLLGELRRLLRDYESDTCGPMNVSGFAMASPRVAPRDESKNVPRLDLKGKSIMRDRAPSGGFVPSGGLPFAGKTEIAGAGSGDESPKSTA